MATAKQTLASLIADATPDACVLWPLGKSADGYGRLRYGGRALKAHRAAYHLHHGVLPDYLKHSCDVRLCCNPHHLSPGTHLENMQEMRQRTCPGGVITAEQLEYILTSPLRNADLARELDVDPSTISKIRSGTRRTT